MKAKITPQAAKNAWRHGVLQSAPWRTARTSWTPAMEVKVSSVGWENSSHSSTAAILWHKRLKCKLLECSSGGRQRPPGGREVNKAVTPLRL